MAQKCHTEVVVMPLLWDDKLQDQDRAIRNAIEMNNTMTGSQPGFQRGLWAIRDASPRAFVTFTDWDDISCHERFMAHPDHQELLDALTLVSSGDMQMFHTSLSLGMGSSVSPVKKPGPIDMVMGFFPLKDVGDLIQRRPASETSAPSDVAVHVKAYASGWSMEDGSFWSDDLKEVERAGKGKEKVWLAIYNWGDLETQDKARAAGIVESQTEWIVQAGGERQIEQMVMSDYSECK